MIADFHIAVWFGHVAAGSLFVLVVGWLIARFVRQPIDRLQVITWTLVASIVIPCLTTLPGVPRWAPPIDLSFAKTAQQPTEATQQPAAATPKQVQMSSESDLDNEPFQVRHELTGELSQEPSSFESAALTATASAKPKTPDSRAQTVSLGQVLTWLVSLYFLVAALLVIRWFVAYRRLTFLYQSSKPASDRLHEILLEIAGKDAAEIQVRTSCDVDAPLTWGRRNPVILLPESTENMPDVPVRCAIAHEWSHIERRDATTVLLAAIAEVLFFYQPAFWWMKRQIALCQDFLADARASQFATSTADYAQLLVNMAKQRTGLAPMGALGIGDRKTRLFARVAMLVQAGQPLRHSFAGQRNWCVAPLALILAIGISTIEISTNAAEKKSAEKESKETAKDAAVANEEPAAKESAVAKKEVASDKKDVESGKENEPKPADQGQDTETLPEPIVYQGKVTDRKTNVPIEGVSVEVVRQLSRDPETGEWITLETTTHKTNKEGIYEFNLPPEQVAQSSLYLIVDAHHPKYASKGRSGYSHTMIRKNLELGEEPFYAHIQLNPGEAVTGIIESPDGKPLAGVEILTYSKSSEDMDRLTFGRGSFQKAKTDKQGRFTITIHTPGDGVLWIKPEAYSPQAHRLKDKRGDWGIITVRSGKTVTGRVLDTQGNPVANAPLDVRRRGDGEEPDEFLRQNAVAGALGRQVTTNDEGNFEIKSLPDGDYRMEVRQGQETKIEHVFLPRKISISQDQEIEPLEIRAEPHIFVRATYLNSEGKPRSGHRVHVFGQINGEYFFTRSSKPGDDGKLEIKLPHGLQATKVSLSTNEHSALRWRRDSKSPLNNSRDIDLKTVNDDVEGIEIFRYQAPILLVSAVDEAGNAIEGAKPKLTYEEVASQPTGEMRMYVNGGNVHFEKQQDGRWRTSSLLPDQKFKVTFEADGFATEPRSLALQEGEENETSFVMTKKP